MYPRDILRLNEEELRCVYSMQSRSLKYHWNCCDYNANSHRRSSFSLIQREGWVSEDLGKTDFSTNQKKWLGKSQRKGGLDPISYQRGMKQCKCKCSGNLAKLELKSYTRVEKVNVLRTGKWTINAAFELASNPSETSSEVSHSTATHLKSRKKVLLSTALPKRILINVGFTLRQELEDSNFATITSFMLSFGKEEEKIQESLTVIRNDIYAFYHFLENYTLFSIGMTVKTHKFLHAKITEKKEKRREEKRREEKRREEKRREEKRREEKRREEKRREEKRRIQLTRAGKQFMILDLQVLMKQSCWKQATFDCSQPVTNLYKPVRKLKSPEESGIKRQFRNSTLEENSNFCIIDTSAKLIKTHTQNKSAFSSFCSGVRPTSPDASKTTSIITIKPVHCQIAAGQLLKNRELAQEELNYSEGSTAKQRTYLTEGNAAFTPVATGGKNNYIERQNVFIEHHSDFNYETLTITNDALHATSTLSVVPRLLVLYLRRTATRVLQVSIEAAVEYIYPQMDVPLILQYFGSPRAPPALTIMDSNLAPRPHLILPTSKVPTPVPQIQQPLPQ
ncbi:hypothetical protein EK904_005628 [Melospiza melodia maxima]|nr:hypothetical protein EK904_005628 [Melospiza melodia maxima]